MGPQRWHIRAIEQSKSDWSEITLADSVTIMSKIANIPAPAVNALAAFTKLKG